MPCYVSRLPYVRIKYMMTWGMATAVDCSNILYLSKVTDTNKSGKLQYGYWFPQEFT
jgi:hypothetical protein